MNYHLNRDGRDLGIFPPEELQHRRAAGEWVDFLPADTHFTGWQVAFGKSGGNVGRSSCKLIFPAYLGCGFRQMF